MLSLLFSSLQSSFNTLLSKPFLLGSFLPVVLFLSACAAMAERAGGPARAWVAALNPAQAGGAPIAWSVTVAVIVVVGLSVILSGLNGFLLELSEGKHLGRFEHWLHRGEFARFQRLNREIKQCRKELWKFDIRPAGATVPPWQGLLLEMQRAYRAAPPAKAPPSKPGPEPDTVTLVRDKRNSGGLVAFAELQAAVHAVAGLMAAGLTPEVDAMQDDLIDAVQYGRERLMLEIHRLQHLLHFQFPVAVNSPRGTGSLNVIAATRMGNITRTIRSYALDRYNLDLNVFWTRLMGAMVKEKDALASLQDAKVQVDFLVSLFWLTCLFVALWSGLLIAVVPRPWDFVAVAVAGPLLARWLYLAACQNYIVFADQVRSAIDLYRTDLLDQLRLNKPPGNREEQATWKRVGGWLGYANECDINYKP